MFEIDLTFAHSLVEKIEHRIEEQTSYNTDYDKYPIITFALYTHYLKNANQYTELPQRVRFLRFAHPIKGSSAYVDFVEEAEFEKWKTNEPLVFEEVDGVEGNNEIHEEFGAQYEQHRMFLYKSDCFAILLLQLLTQEEIQQLNDSVLLQLEYYKTELDKINTQLNVTTNL